MWRLGDRDGVATLVAAVTEHTSLSKDGQKYIIGEMY